MLFKGEGGQFDLSGVGVSVTGPDGESVSCMEQMRQQAPGGRCLRRSNIQDAVEEALEIRFLEAGDYRIHFDASGASGAVLLLDNMVTIDRWRRGSGGDRSLLEGEERHSLHSVKMLPVSGGSPVLLGVIEVASP